MVGINLSIKRFQLQILIFSVTFLEYYSRVFFFVKWLFNWVFQSDSKLLNRITEIQTQAQLTDSVITSDFISTIEMDAVFRSTMLQRIPTCHTDS